MFDNDGTLWCELWCEKPMYPQADFLLRRWREMAQAHPGLAKKAAVEGRDRGRPEVGGGDPGSRSRADPGVTEAYEGITTEAFERAVRACFRTARHPVLGVPYTLLGRPMRELIDLLRAADFEVYICSAGGRDFVWVVAEEMYGIPRQNVTGSGTSLEYRHGQVYRARSVEQPVDDGPGKPFHIWTRTGRKPLLAGGNADGDAAMLRTARFDLVWATYYANARFDLDEKTSVSWG